jgi:hypothetical protein
MCLLCQKDKQTKKTYKTTFDAIPYLVSGDGVAWNVESGGLPMPQTGAHGQFKSPLSKI